MDKDKIAQLLLKDSMQMDSIFFIESILLSALLSFIIQIIYIKFSSSFSNKYEFSKIFVILGITTAIVISIVKSSLALSLGLVGALSIVRFRAAIKDPEELVYLFLVIAAGLGCGAGQFKITSIGVLLVSITTILYSYYKKSRKLENSEVLNISIIFSKRIQENYLELLVKAIDPFCKKISFISLASVENQTTFNLDVLLKNFSSISKIEKEIKKKDIKVKKIFEKESQLSL